MDAHEARPQKMRTRKGVERQFIQILCEVIPVLAVNLGWA